MTKCVVFDFMGVVFKEGHIISRVLHPMLLAAGKRVSYEDVSIAYMKYGDGEIDNETFWKQFMTEPSDNYKLLERKFLESLQLDQDFASVALGLKSRGMRLSAVTHLPREWGAWLVQRYDLTRIFDDVFITGELRESKTGPRIYDSLLMRIGLRGQDCLFIDDMPENLSAAAKLGYRTVWMKREEKTPLLSFTPDYVTTSLRNVMNFVD